MVDEMRLMLLPEVIRLCALSRRTIYRMIERGEFPQQLQISTNRVAWYERDIEAWLASRRAVTRRAA